MANALTKLYFLRLDQVASEYGSVSLQLGEVDRTIADVRSGDVDAFYAAKTDRAMLVLRVDADQATQALSSRLQRLAGRMNAELIEIGRKPQPERRRFYQLVMPLYETRFLGNANCVEAFATLRRRIGLEPLAEPPLDEFPPTKPIAVSCALRARFRRGDQWQPGRVRQLTANSIAVATGCPPRKDEVVELEISVADVSVVLEVAVVAVTHSETAATIGSVGFGARIASINTGGKDRFDHLLRLVHDQALIEPPPPRQSPRFPVSWPLLIGRRDRMLALDLSERGMFIASQSPPPLDRAIEIRIPVETGDAPLRASGHVVRVINQAQTEDNRFRMGFGLTLSLNEKDRHRYQELVSRVARRAEYHIVVGASGLRLPQITRSLSAVGYATSSANDSIAFLKKAAAVSRMPDLVLLDSSLQHQDARAAEAVARALNARRARTVRFDDRPTKTAWQFVDAALAA